MNLRKQMSNANYYKKKYLDDKLVKFYNGKRREDVIFRIIDNLARRVARLVKNREYSHMQLIGCKSEELKKYLSERFTDGMTFENYGNWEVDHIMPISSFNLSNESELKKCFNFTNLQPLWKIDNRKKSNKMSWVPPLA